MSRAEKKPIEVPVAVIVAVDGVSVSVSGPKGKLSQTFNSDITITFAEHKLFIAPANGSRQALAMTGTAKAILDNMIVGVVTPFTKQLEIAGVGFKAILRSGDKLELILGSSHQIVYALPSGVSVDVADGGVRLTVTGVDRQKVGQVAADIFSFFPMEPYKGKGVRIVGKFVRRKEGKKAA
ncbi:MAG: 50S ribosomal protein L6 [Puniceicoccales bacterium]|jgi:large subunit ribosomal protein L6|nr:50S ribosomal protein L6 [Puniceicoccales bacterium]